MTETTIPHPGDNQRREAAASQSTSKVTLFFALLALGLLGIVSLLWQPLPMLEDIDLPLSESAVRLLILVQPTILLIVAVLVGVNVAPRVGLQAPLIQAMLNRQPLGPVWQRLIPAALAIGVIGAIVLTLFGWYQTATVPDIVEAAGDTPLLVRLLYGGITEEILLRWGLMSLLVWLGWRFVQGRSGVPTSGIVWGGNITAALLFGVGHLPAAFMVGLTGPLWIMLIIGANALLGILYGWLYWRKGLEAAMIAHGLTHLLAVLSFGPVLALVL